MKRESEKREVKRVCVRREYSLSPSQISQPSQLLPALKKRPMTPEKNKDNATLPEDTAAEAVQEQQPQKADAPARQQPTALQILKKSVREDDPKPSASLTFSKIIGGDILSAEVVRSQIWLFMLIVAFTIMYVAIRYQCQQDIIAIDKLETELKDAKYKALSSSSKLTERCRESHVLEILKNNKDSLLHVADQPPYIIKVPE